MLLPTKKTVSTYENIHVILADLKLTILDSDFDEAIFKSKLATLRTQYDQLDGFSITRTKLDQLPDLLEKSISSHQNETMRREFARIIQEAIDYVANSLPTMRESAKGIVEKTLPHLLNKKS
jgi:hypothetical protein